MTNWNRREREFWSRIEKTETCWLLTGQDNGRGYQVFCWTALGERYAHRVSYVYHTGNRIPEGLDVLHRCDVRNCVNPSHLYVGTQLDNERDKTARNRRPPGTCPNPVSGDDHWTRRQPERVLRGDAWWKARARA